MGKPHLSDRQGVLELVLKELPTLSGDRIPSQTDFLDPDESGGEDGKDLVVDGTS